MVIIFKRELINVFSFKTLVHLAVSLTVQFSIFTFAFNNCFFFRTLICQTIIFIIKLIIEYFVSGNRKKNSGQKISLQRSIENERLRRFNKLNCV